ncbi:MAG TPA: hypothetical protein VFT53_02620 [Candidatus Saccharimonadales bacterium]|nr:hypothetical protein [Candidatus Saccharimonadales bacterium]
MLIVSLTAVGVIVISFFAYLAIYLNHLHHRIYTGGYSDCIQHGGQALRYYGAIQLEACRGNDTLFLQYSAQDMPRLTSEKTQTTANTVIADASTSPSLVNFLKYDYTGCSKDAGYYKVFKEVPGRFAEMSYGCAGTIPEMPRSYIIAMNAGGSWTFISPTNNMDNTTGVPSCLIVDMFKVSKALSPRCWQNTGYDNGAMRAVGYP